MGLAEVRVLLRRSILKGKIMKHFLRNLIFKIYYQERYLSNNYPPGHAFHRSGVIYPVLEDGSVKVVSCNYNTAIRFANVKALIDCTHSGKYQLI